MDILERNNSRQEEVTVRPRHAGCIAEVPAEVRRIDSGVPSPHGQLRWDLYSSSLFALFWLLALWLS